MILIFL